MITTDPIAIDHDKKSRGVKWWFRRIAFGPRAQDYDQEKQNKVFLAVYGEVRRIFAEFLGSYFLILFIAGIGVIDGISSPEDVNLIARGMIGGLVLSGLIFAFGEISGAHFNPVVTCAFFLRGYFNFFRMIEYWVIQFAGGILAAGTLRWMFGNIFALGTTIPNSRFGNGVSVGMEIVITCLLLLVVLSTAEKAVLHGPITSLFVGITFATTQIFGWNISGASVNPFRSLCPAIISGDGLNTIWIYFAGPIAGMLIAVLFNRFFTVATLKEASKVVSGGVSVVTDPNATNKQESNAPSEA